MKAEDGTGRRRPSWRCGNVTPPISFSIYGDRGCDFIEAHHDVIPVSQMGDNATSSIHDIKMVCSNCHRILHLKRPWLKVEELKALINS